MSKLLNFIEKAFYQMPFFIGEPINIRNSKIIEKERLENLLLSGISRVKIGEMFGVSETTVRKWCKKYKIDLQRREER